MGLFSKKNSGQDDLIGVDIGGGGIKMVELISEKGRLRLSTYGHAQKQTSQKLSLMDDPKKAAELMQRIIKESGMKSKKVNAALPSQYIFHTIVTIPQPKNLKDDIKPIIESQVSKLLPRPIGEMILDSTIIDRHLMPKDEKVEEVKKIKKSKADEDQKQESPTENILKTKERKHIRVLVSGAPKEFVQKHVNIFKLAKLELVSLETETFALIRSLIGRDSSKVMIVDIGYERSNISIVSQGIPFLHRSIKAGGFDVTQMMSKQMGISVEQAEQSKIDLARSSQQTNQIPAVIRQALMPILHEIKYALELYSQQDFHDNSTVDKIILTGGSSHLPYIDPFLTEALNINVYLGNPWARIAIPEGIKPMLEDIGPKLSVAAGLAMKLKKEEK